MEFTQTEINYLRCMIQHSISEKERIIANHNRHWEEYSPSDQEWANNRITQAEQTIEELHSLLLKIDK